jgi:hypothetical protein
MRRSSCFSVWREHSSICGRLVDRIRVRLHVAPIHDRCTSSRIRHASERETTGNGTRLWRTLFRRTRRHTTRDHVRHSHWAIALLWNARTMFVAASIVHSYARFSRYKKSNLIGNSDQEWFTIVITIIYNLKLIMNFAIFPYIHVSDATDR